MKTAKIILNIFLAAIFVTAFFAVQASAADDAEFFDLLQNAEDNGTVSLEKDYVLTRGITMTDKTVVLDLCGHTVSAESTPIFTVSGGSLKIMDSSDGKTGVITTDMSNLVIVNSGGFSSEASFFAKSGCCLRVSGGSVSVTGGKLASDSGSTIEVTGSGTVTMNGAAVTSGSTCVKLTNCTGFSASSCTFETTGIGSGFAVKNSLFTLDGASCSQTKSGTFFISAENSTAVINCDFKGFSFLSAICTDGADRDTIRLSGNIDANDTCLYLDSVRSALAGIKLNTAGAGPCVSIVGGSCVINGAVITDTAGTALSVRNGNVGMTNESNAVSGKIAVHAYEQSGQISISNGTFTGDDCALLIEAGAENISLSGGTFSAQPGLRGGISVFTAGETVPDPTEEIRKTRAAGYMFEPESTRYEKGVFTGASGTAGGYYSCSADVVTMKRGCLVVYDGAGNTSGETPKDPVGLYEVGAKIKILEAPEDFQKTGYDFAGWALITDTGTKIYQAGRELVLKEDAEFTATWLAKTYKVIFTDWDGTVLSTQIIKYGEKAEEPEKPQRTGHQFAGWSGDFSQITAPLTVKAQYIAYEYLVEFRDWDGTAIDRVYVKYGTAAKTPTPPERTGYTFTGWDRDVSAITGGTVVTAQYEKEKYEVLIGLKNMTVAGSHIAEYQTEYRASITPNEGYSLPESINVTVGGELLGTGKCTYSAEKGDLVVFSQFVTGDILIVAAGEPTEFGVRYHITDVSANAALTARFGETYSAKLIVNGDYLLPETVDVTVDGRPLSADKFSYDSQTGEIKIDRASITGEIVITAKGVKPEPQRSEEPDDRDQKSLNAVIWTAFGLTFISCGLAVYSLVKKKGA